MAKTYLITGASSDVGTLLIDRLLSHSAPDDSIVAQGCGDLEHLAPLVKKYPGQIKTWDVDLTDSANLTRFLDSVETEAGNVTHIVHLPALRLINVKFKNFDEARFHLDMRVQVDCAVEMCRRFIPKMAKNRYGRVLFMLSSYVLGVPPRNAAAYIVAKEALHGLAKSLASDYAPSGVTVNCVAPTMMETKFLADTPHLIVQMAAEKNPMGRNATPADVVPAMDFLLSDEAGFITGVVLPITGGES